MRALASAGARVLGVDVRETGAAELGQAVTDGSGDYAHELGDVAIKDELEAIRARLTDRWGAATILVCNAGIDQPPQGAATTRRVEEIPSDEFAQTITVNLLGTFHSIQVFGAPMAAAGKGSIVTIGSVYASQAPDPSLYDHIPVDPPFLKPPAYGASKAGAVNLTRYFARLWGPRGVRVNALSPGGARADQDEEFVRKYCARVPLERMADPADLGGPLVFLASDASSYVSGQELRVDGGLAA